MFAIKLTTTQKCWSALRLSLQTRDHRAEVIGLLQLGRRKMQSVALWKRLAAELFVTAHKLAQGSHQHVV